ncbi:hypothetical protein HMPREF0454_00440 [Hafnia alvei ATCC 51873]|uniref:Uncharacterized protein n=1 Tax=Hafnia alvei ATCC 51873 TaxID=1002364 RepID=G9Y1M3_HAFAL|nr:hypothetical protein HMPREF0454_00440 [Hafnia alvei ATCC 51873]
MREYHLFMFDNLMTSELKIHRQSPRRVTQSLLGGSGRTYV